MFRCCLCAMPPESMSLIISIGEALPSRYSLKIEWKRGQDRSGFICQTLSINTAYKQGDDEHSVPRTADSVATVAPTTPSSACRSCRRSSSNSGNCCWCRSYWWTWSPIIRLYLLWEHNRNWTRKKTIGPIDDEDNAQFLQNDIWSLVNNTEPYLEVESAAIRVKKRSQEEVLEV